MSQRSAGSPSMKKMETKLITRMRPLGGIDVVKEGYDKPVAQGLTTFGAMKPTMSRNSSSDVEKTTIKFPSGFCSQTTDLRLQPAQPINIGPQFKFTACFAGSMDSSEDNEQLNVRGNPGATSMGPVTVFKVNRDRLQDNAMYHEQWQHSSLISSKSSDQVDKPRSNEHIHSKWVLDNQKVCCFAFPLK